MITLIILTYNEELHLQRCLESVKNLAERIIIVDSFSTDRTSEIAQNHGAKFLQRKFINQADQLNWALENLNIDTEWILRLDADEYLDCYFDLKEFLKNEELFKDAYLIKIKNIDKDEKNKLIDEFLAIRLFKNDINILQAGFGGETKL